MTTPETARRPRGRPPIGDRAMTPAERMRRMRARRAALRKSDNSLRNATPAASGPDEPPLIAMRRAWERASEAERAEIRALALVGGAALTEPIFRHKAPLRNEPPAAPPGHGEPTGAVLTERDFSADAIGALFQTMRGARSQAWRTALRKGIPERAVADLLTRYGDWRWRKLDRLGGAEFETLAILLSYDFDVADRFGVTVERYGQDPATGKFRLRPEGASARRAAP
jgi:hypothetical protein